MATSARCAALISASRRTGSKLERTASTQAHTVAGVRGEPLAGRCRRVIALANPRALALLLGQLERRLEEVHEQPHRRIKTRQGCCGRHSLQAPIAHDAADHGPVLLQRRPRALATA